MDIMLKIFLTFVVSHKVKSRLRLVVNTTCFELAKPSNQQFRLTCRQYDYHCLLDDTFTKEYEVCREWKWIPGGKCAYFNTYSDGNIDGRPCINSANLICPIRQYSSAENTKYNACYLKKIATKIEPRTRILHVTSTGTFEGGNSTNIPKYETNDKQHEKTIWAVPIVYVIVITVTLIAVVSFYFGRFKCFQQLKKVKSDSEEENEENSSEKFEDANDTASWAPSKIATQDSSNIHARRKDEPLEHEPFLGNEMDAK